MNFEEVEQIIEEGKFKKAVAGALLGATLASGAMAQDAKVRTRRPSNPNPNRNCFEWIDSDDGPTELKDTIFQFPPQPPTLTPQKTYRPRRQSP